MADPYRPDPLPVPPPCDVCCQFIDPKQPYLVRHESCAKQRYQIAKEQGYQEAKEQFMSWTTRFWHLIAWCTFLLLFTIISSLLYITGRAIAADGSISYCYTELGEDSMHTLLKGHREWSMDRTIGTFPDVYQAFLAAKAMNCPVK